jgi:hypothetical protein
MLSVRGIANPTSLRERVGLTLASPARARIRKDPDRASENYATAAKAVPVRQTPLRAFPDREAAYSPMKAAPRRPDLADVGTARTAVDLRSAPSLTAAEQRRRAQWKEMEL